MATTTRMPNGGNRALFQSGLVAVAACLAVNDAGVVAASLCIVMLWARLAEENQAKRPAA